MKATDIYTNVTATIVRQLETADPSDWRMPWHDSVGLPHNALTGNAYRGGNVIALWAEQLVKEYDSQTWATWNQWNTIAGITAEQIKSREKAPAVRKGERATHLVKWVAPDEKRKAEAKRKGKRAPGMIPFGFAVFNLAQVDDVEPVAEPEGPDPIESAEAYFAAVGARVGRGSAAYVPSRDTITMPARHAFHDAEGYYATLGHEHVHWTGHASRLARDGIVNPEGFGTASYAFEELVAELGAAFTCAALGVSTEPRPDHAQYIASWIRLLRGDDSALYKAASLAQRAHGYLDGAAGAVINEGAVA